MKSKGTALVTGAARRIGRALVAALSRAGYRIALNYKTSKKDAEALAREIKADGGRLHAFQCDLSSEKDTLKLIAQVKRKYPDLNALVNNASVFKPSKIAGSSMELFHETMNVNFIAPYILSKHFAKSCKKGSIINILDTHITQNKNSHADYLLSKKALAELSVLCATEFAPKIRVNAIAPGLILPPEGKSNAYLKKRAKNIPLKKKGSPENIARAALFLLENKFITGQTIFVDGGEHLI